MTDPSSHAIDIVLVRFERYRRATAPRYGIDEADVTELAQDVRIRLWRAHETDHPGTEAAIGSARETIRTLPTSYVVKAIASSALDLVRRRRAHQAGETRSLLDPSLEGTLAVEADGPSLVESEAKLRNLTYRGLADLREALQQAGISTKRAR